MTFKKLILREFSMFIVTVLNCVEQIENDINNSSPSKMILNAKVVRKGDFLLITKRKVLIELIH